MAKKNEAPPAPAYPINELLAKAEVLFAVKPEVLAGAIYDRISEMTIDEAAKLIHEFMKRKVR
ncbi:hypothetical protein [Paenibacillus sp. MSJ-34]|uniref:hypothetical protein n=1 Tax=Paenibacillus sp. MSJ-34 TaxID=2841529 RepID=UPI001C105105|nr:hypothetical protein [Paenibacillus sp. MSJ-34]MBU5441210.1 hypothetical protein [Paenibacillus sp. MSJ-34]